MGKESIVFREKKTKKVLSKISVDGVFEGEIGATKSLLAYEQGIDEKDIEVITE